MEPKPIQDIAPPGAAKETAEPPAGPEIVHDIPVRQPSQNTSYGEDPLPSQSSQSPSSIISEHLSAAKKLSISLPHLDQKTEDNPSPVPKAKKPRPVLAMAVFAVAMICLAAGSYLKFVASS